MKGASVCRCGALLIAKDTITREKHLDVMEKRYVARG